jgi:hypothetical protein
MAGSPQQSVFLGAESGPSIRSRAGQADGRLSQEQSKRGGISGRIVDRAGTGVAQANVRLTRADDSVAVDVLSNDDGQFSFSNISAGRFDLTIASLGFATQELSGELGAGENYMVPEIVLVIATAMAEVRVVPSQVDVAEDEIKEQEKQRALGFIPNFYVSYVADAVPLTSKQKFELAWKTIVDPVTFGLNGAIAGVEQAQDDFGGYGQGAQGYGKRYGAAYADLVTGTFIGSAILPSLLKQDPRYFYKGTGSKRSRVLYALASAVICKGDNGHWQANYSSIAGSLAAGGISNLYYPSSSRNAASLTFENALIGIGATAAANLFQEFVVRKFTPKIPQRTAKSQSMNGGLRSHGSAMATN